MVVFGSKSSSVKTKLFEQPLDKLLSPKTVKQLNEAIKKNKQNHEAKCRQLKHGQQINYDHNNNNYEEEDDEQCRLLMLKVLPQPIKLLLCELYSRGPSTVGIFRKSPNAKHCKELRQKLESPDGHSSIEQYQVNVVASVFKEWLRSLPDCLLMSRLYPQWIDIAKLIEPLHLNKLRRQQHRDLAINSENANNIEALGLHHSTSDVRFHAMLSMSQFELKERHSECLRIVRQLLDALNETNLILLRAIICVLWHIANNSEHNMMCSNNLGVCIGQSLLNDEHQQKKTRRSSSLGLCSSMQSHNNLSTSPSSTSSALKHFSASTFAKRHRRTRSQCLLASTLSLTNLSSHLSSSPFNSSTTNLKQQQVNNYSSNYLNSNDAQEAAKYVPILVAFMIDNAKALFGSHIVNLFGPRPDDEQQESHNRLHNQCHSSDGASPQSNNSENSNRQPTLAVGGSLASLPACNKMYVEEIDNNHHNLPICQPMEGITHDSPKASLTNQQNTEPNNRVLQSSGQSDLTVRSSGPNLMNNSPTHNLMTKRHRRNMSTSVITVQIGNAIRAQDHMPMTSSTPTACERDINLNQRQEDSSAVVDATSTILSPADRMTKADTATTSILIVNTPKKQHHLHKSAAVREESCDSGNISNVYNESQSQSVSPSCGSSSSGNSNCNSSGCSLDGNHQQRPLSATESTTSSSRASSSTSGVHSESPAFSSEPDSHHHNCAHRTPTTCSPHQSISVSISSPDPSSSSTPSICTSPIDDMDTVDGSHHQNDVDFSGVDTERHRKLMVDIQDEVGDNCGPSNKLDDANNGSMTSDYKRDSATLGRLRLSAGNPYASRDRERPNSMVNLNGEITFNRVSSQISSQDDKNNKQQSLDQHKRQEQQQFHSREYSNFVTEQNKENSYHRSHLQSQTLNRYTSSNTQQHVAMFNRMPKIPFQYTTSCYGGEAVLYYPSNAHLSQQHQQQQSYQAPRGCNRIQSLDRHTITQYNHQQSHQQQSYGQQQLPQRSHVMMLRDYYLSLQEQSQKQQAFISQRQRATANPANSQNYLQRAQNQERFQFQHLQRHHSTSQQSIAGNPIILPQQHSLQSLELSRQLQQPLDSYSSYTNGLDDSQGGNSGFATTNEIQLHHHHHTQMQQQQQQQQGQQQQQQPASAAVAYQRNRPRLAKIRQNQFNGLYVKRAPSPHSVMGSPERCNSGGLIVRPLSKLETVVAGGAPAPASNGTCAASLMAISQSSLSQQSSKMSSASDSTEQSADDDESDDCSTGEWMESTMV